jgi:hypothetical protein
MQGIQAQDKRQAKEMAKMIAHTKQEMKNIINIRTISKEIKKLSPWATKILLLAIQKTGLYKATITQAHQTKNGLLVGDTETAYINGYAQITTTELMQTYTDKQWATGNTKEAIKEACKELMTVQLKEIKIRGTREIGTFYNVLEACRYDIDKDGQSKIELKFSELIAPILAERKEGYFRLNPMTLGRLKSCYSIQWYMIAMNAISTNRNEIKIKADTDEIKKMFGADETKHDKKHTVEFLIKNPIAELNEAQEKFKLTVEADGKARALKNYIIKIEPAEVLETKKGLDIIAKMKAEAQDRQKKTQEATGGNASQASGQEKTAKEIQKELRELGKKALEEAQRHDRL